MSHANGPPDGRHSLIKKLHAVEEKMHQAEERAVHMFHGVGESIHVADTLHVMEEKVHQAEEKAVHIIHEAEEGAAGFFRHLSHKDGAQERRHLYCKQGSQALRAESLRNIRQNLETNGKADKEEDETSHWIVDSLWFNTIIMMATTLNTVQMGVETDHPEWTTAWLICENVFTGIFVIEMVAKLCVYRFQYFSDRANQLDGTLAVLGVLDVWILAAVRNVNLQSLSILRILRLLRLARVLRLVRRVKPLVLVIQGVIHALSTSAYVFAVCVFIFYVFAIFLTEHLGKTNPQIYPGYSTDPEVIDEQNVIADFNPYLCFGSMMSSMLTLFNMATFTEWGEIVRPIAMKQPMYVPVFLFFALGVGFGVMNVLVGVIVDVVTAESKRIETDFKDRIKKEKLSTLDKIQDMLNEIDANGDGELGLDELDSAMKDNKQLKLLIAKINLPGGWSCDELLNMLDNEGDGVLTHAEFTTSFFRLLNSDDFQQICILQASINQVKHLLRDQNKCFGQMLSKIEHDTSLIRRALGFVLESSDEDDDSSGDKQTAAELKGHSAARYSKRDCKISSNKQNSELPGFASGFPCNGGKEHELISKLQLVVKECIQEEFATIRPCFLSGESCSGPDAKISSVKNYQSEVAAPTLPCLTVPSSAPLELPVAVQLELPLACSLASEDLSDVDTDVRSTNTFKSVLPEGVASAIVDRPQPFGSENSSGVPLLQQDLDLGPTRSCENVSNHEQAAAISLAAQPRPHTAEVEGQRNAGDAIHDFVFEEDTQQLGFEVQWVEDLLPLIGRVLLGGTAAAKGVLQGDRLAACNGVSFQGKDRPEVLQLLSGRPLMLTTLRSEKLEDNVKVALAEGSSDVLDNVAHAEEETSAQHLLEQGTLSQGE